MSKFVDDETMTNLIQLYEDGDEGEDGEVTGLQIDFSNPKDFECLTMTQMAAVYFGQTHLPDCQICDELDEHGAGEDAGAPAQARDQNPATPEAPAPARRHGELPAVSDMAPQAQPGDRAAAPPRPAAEDGSIRHFEGSGTGSVTLTHMDANGVQDRVETRDGRVFTRVGKAEWNCTRNGHTELVRNVYVLQNGELSYRPADDSGRTIRERLNGRIFVRGRDDIEREYVDSANFADRPAPPVAREGGFLGIGSNMVCVNPESADRPRYAPQGGEIQNDTQHPIIVLGNSSANGRMSAYVLRPGAHNHPMNADIDGVVTDSRFQPIVSSSGRILMPASIPADAAVVKIRDTGRLSITGNYGELDVSGSWLLRSSGTLGPLLSGDQPVTPEVRPARR